MNLKKIKLQDFLIIVFTILLASWRYIPDAAEGKQGVFFDLIKDYKNYIPIFIAGIVILLYICKLIKDDLSKATVLRFLNLLHKKHFPHQDGGLHPGYRVTIFRPRGFRQLCLGRPIFQKFLKFYARSGGTHPKSRVKWSITSSEVERFDGITGYAWVNDFVVALDNLPDYNSDPKNYCKLTHITERKAKRVHWHARSFRAVVMKNSKGEKVGILMMESVQPNGLQKITSGTLRDEAQYFQVFLSD
jgi:hypothetical protein